MSFKLNIDPRILEEAKRTGQSVSINGGNSNKMGEQKEMTALNKLLGLDKPKVYTDEEIKFAENQLKLAIKQQVKDENDMIKLFHKEYTAKNIGMKALIDHIITYYPRSVVLHYYMGMYYMTDERARDPEKGEKIFQFCLQLYPKFTATYFDLSKYYFDTKQNDKGMRLMEGLFNEKWLTDHEYNRTCAILSEFYRVTHKENKTEKIYKTMLEYIVNLKKWDSDHVEAWKNINAGLANIIAKNNSLFVLP